MYEDKTHAEVVADSIWDGVRLVTFRATFPRFILAEFNTHRAFSRNSASSRAIPLKKQIELVSKAPFYPQSWPKNRAGMSSSENLTGSDIDVSLHIWWEALNAALDAATRLEFLQVHKQIAARLLEPFMWHSAICSTTMPGLENFLCQRDSLEAQPEIALLAKSMRSALSASTTIERDMHVPFCEKDQPSEADLIVAVARCARTSYGREMEEKSYEEDVNLVTRLINGQHWSPFEHVAAASGIPDPEILADRAGARLVHQVNFEAPWAQLRHNIALYLPTIAARLDSE